MLVCAWLALVPSGIAAGDVTGAVVAVMTGPDADGHDTLRRIVASSIELHLRHEGIAVLDGGSWSPGEDPLQALGTGSGGIDADFVLIAALDVRETDVVIELALARLDDRSVPARTQAIEPVGLMLDRVVTRLCAEIVEHSRRQLALAAKARRGRAVDRTPNIAEHTGDGTADVPHADSREAPSVPGAGAPVGAHDPADAPEFVRAPELVGAPEPAAPRRFYLSARFAPLVPIDDAARFLDVGHGVGIGTAVRPFSTEWFRIGLSAHSTTGTASGVAARADYEFAAIGISVLFSGTGMPAVPYLRLTGGRAVLYAYNELLGSIRSTVPYGAGDLGTVIQLFGPFALEIAVGFTAYWTGTAVILGAVPGIGLVLRF